MGKCRVCILFYFHQAIPIPVPILMKLLSYSHFHGIPIVRMGIPNIDSSLLQHNNVSLLFTEIQSYLAGYWRNGIWV